MAVMNLESLVLRGIPVANDVAVSLKRSGSNPAQEGTSALLSPMRNPAPTSRSADYQPPTPILCADDLGTDRSAERAGRPESGVGVPASRSPARTASQAILFGWSLAAGATCFPIALRLGLAKAKTGTPGGQAHHGRSPAERAGARRQRSGVCLLQATRSTAHADPVSGTPGASTRGKGAR